MEVGDIAIPKLPLIFFLTLAYIAGIILAEYIRIPLWLLLTLILIFLIILGAGLVAYGKATYFIIPCLLFLLLGLFFTTITIIRIEKGVLPKIVREAKLVKIIGVVDSEPRLKSGYRGQNALSFNLNVEKVRLSQTEWRIRERVRVNINRFQREPEIDIGQRLVLEGQLSLPKSNTSSSFDYKKYLFRQAIQTILNARPDQLRILNQTTNPLIATANIIRKRIKQSIYQSLSGDRAGLMLGILIGDTTGISEDLQDDFGKTGLTHILAVSGLNVGMLLLICLGFLRFLGVKLRLQCLLTTLVIILYTLITRSEPSVLRASIMAIFGLGAWLLGKEKNLMAAISLAALALLIYDPFSLYNVGFQLSFAATLAIIFLNPILEKRLEAVPPRLRGDLSICLAAQLGVAPLLVYYFNQISLISLLANMLVIPANAPVLTLGIISVTASFTWSALSHLVNFIAGLFLSYMIKVTQILASFPGVTLQLATPSLLNIGAYYILLGSIMFKLSKPKKRRLDSKILIIVLALAVVFIWWQVAKGLPPKQLTVTYLDVGQADATLIQTMTGENVLIDGGENPDILQSALVSKGVRKIDLIILSHPHADHLGGLTEVVKNYKVGSVLDGGQTHPSPLYEKFLTAVKKQKIPYQLARRGQEFKIGRSLDIFILHPTENFISGTTSDINNNSVVAKISYGKVSFLFTGDIEEEAQFSLLSYGERLKAEILKVPHHGSANGSNMQFLQYVQPEVAIIQVGAGNPFGHPAQSTLGKLKSLGAQIYRTDKDGDVTVRSDGKKVEVRSER